MAADGINPAIEAVFLIVRSCRKEQRVCWLPGNAIAEDESPETVDLDRSVVCRSQLSPEFAGTQVERADPSVTEVADEKGITEAPEIRRRQREAPWRVELTVRHQSMKQIAIGIEHIDEAKSLTGNVILLGVILLRIGDIEIAEDVLDAEWRIAARNPRVAEATRRGHRMKRRVEHINSRMVKIRRV
jgi:hypothetical protein